MDELFLFTDGSVNTKSKIGCGAYLVVADLNVSAEGLKKQVKTSKFENTSSTKLELQTLLWALETFNFKESKISVYTDSQNIMGLLGRRDRLVDNNYLTKKNELIRNAELYKSFYMKYDELNFNLYQVKGHKPSNKKEQIDKIFSIVDLVSRKRLRDSYS